MTSCNLQEWPLKIYDHRRCDLQKYVDSLTKTFPGTTLPKDRWTLDSTISVEDTEREHNRNGFLVCKRVPKHSTFKQPVPGSKAQSRDVTEDEYSALPDLGSLMLQALADDARKTLLAPVVFVGLLGKSLGESLRNLSDWLENRLIRKTVYDLEYQYEKSLEEPGER